MNVGELVAIDVHTHVQARSAAAASRRARRRPPWPRSSAPTALLKVPELAAYYRERDMACVSFMVDTVDWAARSPTRRSSSSRPPRATRCCRSCSIDPHRGAEGVAGARRLLDEHAVRGFKFHPSLQAFFPDDRMAYPLYEVIAEHGLPAVFHTGQTAVGSGQRGGGGVLLKYSNPMHLDEVAADFPDMTMIMAHPSVPWQDEALSVAVHKPNVWIDLSGWSPKYFPPQLVRYANPLLKEKVLFGTDFPR